MAKRSNTRVVRQHLQTERLLGIDAVPIRPVAGGVEAALPAANASAPVAAPLPKVAHGPTIKPGPPPAGALPFVPAAVAAHRSGLDRSAKLAILEAMDQKEVRTCSKCELCKGRTQTVFGEGDPDARIMFVGEGPGQTEDELGRPFVGRAGELLDKMIVAMGLQRSQVYIANVVKCRPPGNRTPLPTEVDACWDYLLRQIETISPQAIVTLGGPATKKLVQTDTGITALRGTWQSFTTTPGHPAIPLMPTFHPAYVLRNYTPDCRRKVWSDLQKVMALIKGE